MDNEYTTHIVTNNSPIYGVAVWIDDDGTITTRKQAIVAWRLCGDADIETPVAEPCFAEAAYRYFLVDPRFDTYWSDFYDKDYKSEQVAIKYIANALKSETTRLAALAKERLAAAKERQQNSKKGARR